MRAFLVGLIFSASVVAIGANWTTYSFTKTDEEGADTFSLISDDGNQYMLGTVSSPQGEKEYTSAVISLVDFDSGTFKRKFAIGTSEGVDDCFATELVKVNNSFLVSGAFRKMDEANSWNVWRVPVDGSSPQKVFADSKEGTGSIGYSISALESVIASAGEMVVDGQKFFATAVSIDGGETFKVVDKFQRVQGVNSSARDVLVLPEGIFTVGISGLNSLEPRATVRFSKDQGSTWQTLSLESSNAEFPNSRSVSVYQNPSNKNKLFFTGEILNSNLTKGIGHIWELNLATMEVVSKAEVFIQGADRNLVREMTTDFEGNYFVALKSPGTTENQVFHWQIVKYDSTMGDPQVVDLYLGKNFNGAAINFIRTLDTGEVVSGGYDGGNGALRKLN